MMEKIKRSVGFPWLMAAFLCLYIGLTALAVTAMVPKSQPQTVPTEPTPTAPAEPDAEGIFRSLFEEPDWAALYQRAGEQGTVFEDAEAFSVHMHNLIGETTLSYQEVYTDLPHTHRYLVYADQTKIAIYTVAGPDWALEDLQLFYQPGVSVTVEACPEYTVYVNGVALDERYTIRTLETLAEQYLPDGLHGYRRKWQRVDHLLAEPEITVLDENGTPVDLERDSETGIYRIVEQSAAQMTETEADLARKAAIADAKYAIGAISGTQLKTYFDENSDLYKMLVTNPRNLQKYTSSSIDEKTMQVSDYVRYSDSLFSVNVKLTQKIIRTTGTLKVYQLDKTYFFTLTDKGYRVTDYTNEDVTAAVEQIRLTFVCDDAQTSVLVSPGAGKVSVPELTAPEGLGFLGWASRTVAEDGTVTMTIRILPDGTALGLAEPLILYPVYQ